MLTSLGFIFLIGLGLGAIFNKLQLPSLIGMMFTGILLGPYGLDVLDQSLLGISADLRQFALVIILTRAGLSLDLKDLKKVGRPAVLMCFLPACFEIMGVILIAPVVLGISRVEAAIMGAVLAAVSPAVIVPRMLRCIEEGYGSRASIPQLILAGASVDDIFVVVLFTAFTGLATGKNVELGSFGQIPISIFVGMIIGIVMGLLMTWFFKRYHMRDSIKILIILSISFLLIALENWLMGIISMSGLLAIMTLGITLNRKYEALTLRLSAKYNKLWIAAEVILFVLVGATVDLNYAMKAGVGAILVVVGALIIRILGVYMSLFGTKLTIKEKVFCMVAYTPKATVQAAIGGIPLSMGLPCGQLVLTIAVLAILMTAPFGAIGIDKSYRKLLKQN